jgi:hypothetical protein
MILPPLYPVLVDWDSKNRPVYFHPIDNCSPTSGRTSGEILSHSER